MEKNKQQQKRRKTIADFFSPAQKKNKPNNTTDNIIDVEEEEEDENNNISTASNNDTTENEPEPQPESSAELEASIGHKQPLTRPTTSDCMEADEPFQPHMKFPGRKCGKETFERSFQQSWFDKWPWLHYVKETDSVLCFICTTAVKKRLLRDDTDSTFAKGGFTNWKRATEKFHHHELSDLHSDSSRAIALLKQTPINALISNAAARDQQTARAVLQLLFRSIKYLGRMGMPLRGHEHRDGALWQLMMERTHDLPKERAWLLRRDNWMSDTIQNEVIKMFAHAIQRDIAAEAEKCHFFGLTADGTTDISTSEQFSCCLQFVDSTLTAHNMFLGFYNARDSTAETLFLCIKDIFLRFNLPLERLQGYCFDGAANMSGRFNGVQAKLKIACPGSLYVHCNNHALDLALQEVSREVTLVADSLNFVQAVSVIIRESSKRKTLFQSLFGTEEVVCNILGLCPTRWCIRANAISRVITAYPVLLETLKTFEQDKSMRGETRAKVAGLYKQAKKAKTYFGLVISEALFEPSEAVARSLQCPKITAGAALECINVLKQKMKRLREDASVNDLMTKVETFAQSNTLKMPTPTRAIITPSRFRDTSEPEAVSTSPEDGLGPWRRQFYEALDLINAEVFNVNCKYVLK